MSALELRDVVIRPRTGGDALFAPLTVTVPAGTITTVMGPSGIGKSTLIDFIGGHLAPDFVASGSVALNGLDVTGMPAEARRIGILFQDALLFPHLSVGENLGFGLSAEIRGRSARRAAVDAALDQAGLGGLHDRDPATLSGGQRARAALMRTLLAGPRALLLDEPFSRLDPALRQDVRGFVFDHIRTRSIPVLMVSHDAADAEDARGPIVSL
ncbi:MAG: ATP-binding cassette domain-containing protein [Rhodobacteraceae bacterium]|nr:ATP-binding cassette domain-containing protein [Paracoccaceae bacterium]